MSTEEIAPVVEVAAETAAEVVIEVVAGASISADALSPVSSAIYGAIQGATEFLPVSSSGHLALAQKCGLGDLPDDLLLPFSLLLHVGSLVAIVYAFRREVYAALSNINVISTRNLMLSTVPAIIVGLTCKDYIKKFEANFYLLALSFCITSIVLFITHRRMQSAQRAEAALSQESQEPEKSLGGSVLTRASARQALIIGLAQATALLPGISRSGSCICAALLCGMLSLESLSYAFIVGIPLIAGAAAYELLKSDDALAMFTHIELLPLLIGFGLSVAVGLLAIVVLRFVMVKNHLNIFSMYTAVIALICLSMAMN